MEKSLNARTSIYPVRVEFGDCDPAQIVWYPNFFRWIDAASRDFFTQCGVPRWQETERTLGVIGTPLVDTQARFIRTASYGDTLEVHTCVSEWRNKSFVQTHRILRGEELIMQCDEVRIFAERRPEGGIRAVPIPEEIRRLCE
ncbi:MAG: acyl-CoA thioesterase [Noviherbaspirillum sp.]